MADEINFEVTGFGQLRQQLREAQLEMIKLAESGKQGSAEFLAAAQKAGKLKEAIKDAAESADVFTTEGKFQAVTKSLAAISGGFTAVQGALGLVTKDTKAFEETFQKLQSAMALTQGLAALSEAGDAFKNLGSAAVGAFNSMKAAIGSTGVGLLIIGLGIAVQQLMSYFDELSAAEARNKRANEELATSIELLERQYALLSRSVSAATQVEIARAKLAGKSEAEIVQIRKKGTQEQLKVLQDRVDEEAAQLNKREAEVEAAYKREEISGADRMKSLQEITDQRIKLFRSEKDQKDVLNQQLLLLDVEYQQAIKDAGTKFTEDERQRKLKALEDQKNLDIASIEQQKITALKAAKTDEERATIEDQYLEKSVNRQKKFETEKEDLAKKEDKSKTALEARLKELDNERAQSAVDLEKLLKDAKEKGLLSDEEIEKKRKENFRKASEEEYQQTLKNIDLLIAAEETALRKRGLSEEELVKELEKLETRKLNLRKTAAQDYVQTTEQASADVVNIELELQKKLEAIAKREREEARKTKLAKIQAAKEYADTAIALAQGVTDAFAARNDAQKQMEIEAVKASTQTEEQKAKALDEINKNYFEKDKDIQIANAIISTLSGALNAFMSTLKVDPSGITGSILAAAALAAGYFQIEKIKATTYQSSLSTGGGSESTTPSGGGRYGRYEEGGVLMGPSHDMGGIKTALGELEGGEFVVNKRSTANFLPLLEQINSLGNTPGPNSSGQVQIVKTYVVASDMTSQQEADARLSQLARL